MKEGARTLHISIKNHDTQTEKVNISTKLDITWYNMGRTIDKIAECLSMWHIMLRVQRVPTVEYVVCVYIYLFIGLSRSTVVNDSLLS